jgi:hypothetical protein
VLADRLHRLKVRRQPMPAISRKGNITVNRRNRNDRAYGHQYSRGRVQPGLGHRNALFVLVFMLVAAPFASFIPLSALAGVLVVVCWNMAKKEEFLRLLHDWRSATVVIATFGLTPTEDLTFGSSPDAWWRQRSQLLNVSLSS